MNIFQEIYDALNGEEYDDFFLDKLLQGDKKVAQDFKGLYFSNESIKDYAEKIIEGIDMYAMREKLPKSEVFF